MNALPGVSQLFLKGQQTMRHTPGAANSTGSDMFIKSTYSRFGHRHSTQKWVLTLHSCGMCVHDIEHMRHDISRIQIVKKRNYHLKLVQCIYPLDLTGHPSEILNINALQIGRFNGKVWSKAIYYNLF